ncbi:uncharacterized protein LOC127114596 [Lathyrus oleraceus]|uniref:uncharacterized protein LOC127114596 n=1 Tax=Pisum sativum TaxID=3888 RepID=UPI0021D2B547|nr:uncharacterized protein LOC127114596 [Pisum sativum]
MNEPNPLLPDNIKPPYPIIKKKLVLLKGGKHKLAQEQVNMTEKKETIELSEVPPKMKDPREFNITCTIGGLKIPHALCDLGSSINVTSLRKFKELDIREIISNNMTLTLADSSVTRPLGIVQDMLVHVDGLNFPVEIVVIDMKKMIQKDHLFPGIHSWQPGRQK